VPIVDVVILTRNERPLPAEVARGLQGQHGVDVRVHRIVGRPMPTDRSRWEAIARARNMGRSLGTSPWMMFVDDDVVLEPDCIRDLLDELGARDFHAALAADYLGERRADTVAHHVAMGATLFRRPVVRQIQFRWEPGRCECQCCCDDLRSKLWAIDYSASARARHLPGSRCCEHRPAE
jgi:hypothetical protein